MVEISETPLEHTALVERVRHRNAGAVCSFFGTVREMTGDARTLELDYEAYPEMATKELEKLETEACRRWPLIKVVLAHRVGRLALGDVAVVVAVSSPHRAEAFDACRWLIDTIKEVVPIWKRERWADGRSEWIHPQRDGESGSSNSAIDR